METFSALIYKPWIPCFVPRFKKKIGEQDYRPSWLMHCFKFILQNYSTFCTSISIRGWPTGPCLQAEGQSIMSPTRHSQYMHVFIASLQLQIQIAVGLPQWMEIAHVVLTKHKALSLMMKRSVSDCMYLLTELSITFTYKWNVPQEACTTCTVTCQEFYLPYVTNIIFKYYPLIIKIESLY